MASQCHKPRTAASLTKRREGDVVVVEAALLPRGLLSENDAALWLGISKSTLRSVRIPRRVLGARRLYDVRDLTAFRESLPYEDDIDLGEASCDAAFG